ICCSFLLTLNGHHSCDGGGFNGKPLIRSWKWSSAHGRFGLVSLAHSSCDSGTHISMLTSSSSWVTENSVFPTTACHSPTSTLLAILCTNRCLSVLTTASKPPSRGAVRVNI